MTTRIYFSEINPDLRKNYGLDDLPFLSLQYN